MIARRRILTAGLGLALSQLLVRPARAVEGRAKRAKHVIVLWMNGGPSHLDTWDPKPGKVAGPARAIKTSVPGVLVSEHLPRMAAKADRLALIRGMTSREGNHQRARYFAHTGYAPNPTVAHPSLGGWVSKRLPAPESGLPAFVSLGGPSAGAGFFGVEHGPFLVRVPGKMPDDVERAPGIDEARFASRRSLLDGMEAAFSARTGADPKVDGRRALYAKADRLMHAAALEAFDVSKESASVLAAFGATPFGDGCLTAARLVSAGVRFVEVTLDGWDTHKDNFARTERLLGIVDPAMSALLDVLEQRGLADETIVLWIGEFGRSPRINPDEGRDHHPGAWTAVLAGGGLRRGVVHGETDATGARVVKDAVGVPDLFATIATALGLAPDDTAVSPAGRPIDLTDHGVPIRSLLG